MRNLQRTPVDKVAYGIAMLGLISVIAVAILSNGCATRNMVKLMQATGKDPASIRIRIGTIYGTVEVTRTNPNTNTVAHSLSPDGTITVGKDK